MQPSTFRSKFIHLLIWVISIFLFSGCSGGETSSAQGAAQEAATATVLATPSPVGPQGASAVATPTPSATVPPTPVPPTSVPKAVPTIDAANPLSHTYNILVLGSDRRTKAPNWLTDVIMIAAIDLAHQRVGIISFPRDIYVQIPGHSANKINVIDYLGERDEAGGGGPKLMMKVLQKNLGIRLDAYVRFDFRTFMEVVDTVGGVDVEVKCTFTDYPMDDGTFSVLRPGTYHFTGLEAITYVRHRTNSSDLDRARRQQQLMWAVRNRLVETGYLTKIPGLYSALSDSVQSDIGLIDVVRLARFGFGLQSEHVHGFIIASPLIYEDSRNGMFVFIADWPRITQAAQKVFDSSPLTQATECK